MSKISDIVSQHRPQLEQYEDLYKHFHTNPELSFMEKETAAKVASHLESLISKFNIKEHTKLNTGIGGHGLALTFKNGSGTTLLLRADMDALPIAEKTGLEYASKKSMKDLDGIEHPVFHGCGHDMHITSLLGAAELLFAARESWSGTLLLIFQPAEEKGAGAQAMVDDGLYTKQLAPIPDLAIGAHVMFHKVGMLGTRHGPFMSAADSLKLTLHGRGSHASAPHYSCDPITMAAYVITRLQSIVSREVAPNVSKVLTVASIHAGNAENVIPETAELKINVRTWSDTVREFVLRRIRTVVDAEAVAHDAPKPPTYDVLSKFPVTINDEDMITKLNSSMRGHFGDAWRDDVEALPGSEDFSILATSVGKPSVFFIYGGMNPELFKEGEDGKEDLTNVPMNHSPYFAPVIQPTLKNAVDAYAVAALTWLKKS